MGAIGKKQNPQNKTIFCRFANGSVICKLLFNKNASFDGVKVPNFTYRLSNERKIYRRWSDRGKS